MQIAMCNAVRHLTTRSNRDGTVRYYFKRRGLPLARLPDPSSPLFDSAYAEKLAQSEAANIAQLTRAIDGYRRHWAKRLWEMARYRANRPCCTITSDEVLALFERQEDRCALSGLRFRYRQDKEGRDPMAPSLDRIDSRDGYTIENCRVVLLAVNIGLNEWGDDVFLKICKAVARKVAA